MARAKKTKKTSRKRGVDFSDEDSVKAAMAEALDVPVEDLSIEEDKGMGSFGEGTVYRVELGSKEYFVVEDEDSAEKLAIAIVTQDLENEPENFNKDFIESHIDKERLRRDLHSDVHSSNYDSLKEEADRRPMEFCKQNDIDIPEPTEKQLRDHAEVMSDDENSAAEIYRKLKEGDAEDKWIELGEEPEVPDSAIEDAAETMTNEQLKDPMSYLEDIYGDEAAAKAIEIAGIDVKAAAEEAVSTDGVGHFLSSYDGNVSDGPGGIVYWRHN